MTKDVKHSLPRRRQYDDDNNKDEDEDEDHDCTCDWFVVSYHEGHSIVPARVLKYMRLLMHHEVPTNAFRAVVMYWRQQRRRRHDNHDNDHDNDHDEDEDDEEDDIGEEWTQWWTTWANMVTPQSVPSTPRLHATYERRMEAYTDAVLTGAQSKLLVMSLSR